MGCPIYELGDECLEIMDVWMNHGVGWDLS